MALHELMLLEELVDGFRSLLDELATSIAGGMSLERWAGTASRAASTIVQRITKKERLTYVGGYVTFRKSPVRKNMVEATLDLYFQDAAGRWRTTASTAEIRRASFDSAALRAIDNGDGAAFELE